MTKSTQPIIKLTNVWKTYQMGETQVHALRGLNLEVYEGEFVAIMGKSGAGKSTAMNLIGCLDIPTSGVIELNSKNISHMSESSLAQIRGKTIGFIFQKFNLINTLSAKENIVLPLIFQDYSLEQREKIAKKLLQMVELEDRQNHKPNELSGGQQQRVAIARALATNPKVILADEPTGNLDSKTGDKVIDFLKTLHKEGKTIVMVTHDEDLAKVAQRIEILSDGQIIKHKK
ncbi:MAG: ABC transporter ATP-binding protein [Candidatus Nanoarchaeia archaeon]|nr:ABC transporter ATP-binding protein [Candidatus Nanoarchaeia archaeon]